MRIMIHCVVIVTLATVVTGASLGAQRRHATGHHPEWTVQSNQLVDQPGDEPTLTGFGFNGSVSGFPTGEVFMTGGGAYDPQTASDTIPTEDTFVHSAGTFRCTASVAQGPMSGCETRQGVRWDSAQLLASTGFKCTGADAGKTATTDDHTVVILGDFYRAGDGIDESFADVRMIVADHDIAPDFPGIQNMWIQGVGCGFAIAHFSH